MGEMFFLAKALRGQASLPVDFRGFCAFARSPLWGLLRFAALSLAARNGGLRNSRNPSLSGV